MVNSKKNQWIYPQIATKMEGLVFFDFSFDCKLLICSFCFTEFDVFWFQRGYTWSKNIRRMCLQGSFPIYFSSVLIHLRRKMENMIPFLRNWKLRRVVAAKGTIQCLHFSLFQCTILTLCPFKHAISKLEWNLSKSWLCINFALNWIIVIFLMYGILTLGFVSNEIFYQSSKQQNHVNRCLRLYGKFQHISDYWISCRKEIASYEKDYWDHHSTPW